MIKKTNFLSVLKFFSIGTSFVFVVAMAMIISIPQAKAESPNILVGENMSVGSTGRGVVVLQGLLAEAGYLNIPVETPMGYYGALTQNAVSRYQIARGVSPSGTGYFGPLTKIAMHQEFLPHGWLTLLGW